MALMKIRNRLLLSLVVATLLPICMIGVVSYSKAKVALKQAQTETLETITDLKVEKIETFFLERKCDVKTAQDDQGQAPSPDHNPVSE